MKEIARLCSLGLAAVFAVPVTAHAQSLPPQQLELQQLLEKKFSRSKSAPKTRSLAPPGGAATDRPAIKPAPDAKGIEPGDFYLINPDGSVKQAPAQRAPSGLHRGDATDAGGSTLVGKVRSWLAGGAQDGAPQRSAGPATTRGLAPAAHEAGSTFRPVIQAQVAVKKDSYVIQLKPGVSSEEIDALLEKYDLEVTDAVPMLGVIYVTPATPRPATRGLQQSAPRGGTSSTQPETLSDVLAPKIIRDLRREPSVGAAFVNSTVGPKAVPRRVETRAKSGGTLFAWQWGSGAAEDGNWGLKTMRLPPVWTILDVVRRRNPDRPRTANVFLDTGFGLHGQINYRSVFGLLAQNPPSADCAFSHGTHVAGIAGALHDSGRGIDGIVPDARVDIVPVQAALWTDVVEAGVSEPSLRVATLYMDAIKNLSQYVSSNPLPPGHRRVVNVSLAYNWGNAGATVAGDTVAEESLKTHVLSQASVVQLLASLTESQVLYVAAAGNDSLGQPEPVQAKWFTPFAFAATHSSATFQPSPNILIVEAVDRNGARASFSNAGGHVSAPGVDVMSTLAGPSDSYGVCSGTSQASPHVAALAAILLELDPSRSPAEIGRVIRESAIADTTGEAAPRVDALEAVLRLQPGLVRALVDLDGDEQVARSDLEIFKQHLLQIMEEDAGGEPISLDLNGDGDVNGNERSWPLIDFNGSGKVSFADEDVRPVAGRSMSDLDVIRSAWTDSAIDFDAAMAEIGLDQLIALRKAQPSAPPRVAAAPPASQPPAASPVERPATEPLEREPAPAAPAPDTSRSWWQRGWDAVSGWWSGWWSS